MAENIYDIYNKAIKEQQQLATPTAPLSVLDEIQAYRNQLASIRQAEEQKKVQQMSFGKRALQTAGDVFGTVGKGIAKGFEGILDASAALSANFSEDEEEKANLTRAIRKDQVGQSKIVQGMDSYLQGSYLNDTWLEGAIQSVGEMLPSVALNAIPVAGQALSTASFVTSAMGRGAEQALQEGATLEQATKYGVVSGTVEGIIEMASGGVAGVGSGWLSKAFPKVAGKVSTKLMTKPVTRVAMSMIGEGFEEVASEFARPYMERIYKSKENIEPVTMENILQTFTIGALASGIMQGGMVAVTGRTNFRASLIEEQIQNINEKITQETEKGTITPEKSKAYAEQQEALLGQLEETLGATVVVKDNSQQQAQTVENAPQTTQQVTQQEQITTETPQIETQAQQETTTSVPQATESIINQETKTQTLTEGKRDTKQTKQTKKPTTQRRTQAKVEAPTEIKVVESLDDKLELIQDTDGKFNIRITGTDIRLTPKNNDENFMRNVYQQFKKEGTIDKIIESATRRTQSQTKEQESVKDDTKPKSKSSDSKTTKRATSKDTTRTSAAVEQDVTTKQETEQETKQAEEVKQETEQEQPQVKRTGKEIFAEAKTNKKIIYVEKSRYNQTVYEVVNPDAVPQELQPLVEKAKQYNTGLMFFYEEAQNGVITEGLFNYKERAIMINLASETPYEITLTHEIGHRQVATNRIKFNEMYQRFTQLSTKTKAKINELFGVYKDFYEENAEFFGNRQLNEEALFEEFLCNLGAGQVDLDALGIEASELTTLKDFDTEFKAEYLGKALQMDDTKNVLEIEKKLKTMPKYSLRKQTVENPPVAESSTRGKVMVGNIKQKSTFGDTLTWVRRAFTNSMVDVENFFKRNGVANGEALTNKARTARNVGANMITNGIIEVEMEKGKITKITRKAPALAEVFGFLNNKSDNYKAAYFDYLLHRHNISRMDLPFETKANAEQIAILTEARNKNEISQKLYDTLTNSNVTTSHSKVRDMIYEHEGKMTQTTLDTILDLMGDQKPVFGKNVTAQDSEEQVKKYEQTNPEFKAQAEKVYQYNNALLDEQVKAGLITRETADYFRRTYPNYVPTHRFPKGTSRSGLSVNTVQTGINTATGSERVIIDISEQMFNQTMKVSQAIAMNDMLKELGNNADGIDVQLYSEERITDASQIDTEDVGKRNKFSYFDIDVDKNGKRVVKKKSILVSDGMADSIRSALPQTNNETTSKGIKYLRKANVSFKKLTTSLNPFFSFFRNPLRDMQNALIYTKYGIKTFAKNYGRAIREIRSNGAYYQAYLANGGEFSSFYNFEESIKVETKRKGIGKALNKLEEWSNIIEQYPRLAEFISSIEAGNSMEQALLDSADITVNFGRSGIITKWANGTFMPYFNARMQGALKFTRSFEGIMTRQGQKQLAFVLAKMVLLGIGTSLLNDFMYGDDDEYKEMRVDDKSNNFLFKIGGKWIKIPRSEVTTSLASVFNRSKEAREGDEQAFKGFTKDVWNSFSPVQNMRTIFSPIIDAKTNTTWYGGKIEGAKFDNIRPRDRYDESTSSIAKFIGQAINVSPKKVHYVLDQYSGILGDLILPATSQKYSTSVIGKNLTVDPTTSNKYSQRFYNALEEAQYDKSRGDMLAKGKVRYLNKAQDALRELYNAQREVNNNAELSNKEKKEQYEILQVMINNVQKNAVESLKRFSDVLSNFALTDDSFEEDYREATRITFGAETALMNYDKRIYEKAKALYEQGVPYDIYYCVYFDTKEFEGDFDYNGNYIKGSKQIMVWNYINRLNIPKAQKILLYEALGYTYSTKTSNATNDKNPFKAYGS
jgi:hypothetical protein